MLAKVLTSAPACPERSLSRALPKERVGRDSARAARPSSRTLAVIGGPSQLCYAKQNGIPAKQEVVV